MEKTHEPRAHLRDRQTEKQTRRHVCLSLICSVTLHTIYAYFSLCKMFSVVVLQRCRTILLSFSSVILFTEISSYLVSLHVLRPGATDRKLSLYF